MKNKKLFETVLILKGTLTEEEYKKSLESIIKKIKAHIGITKVDEIGKKKLVYEVQKNTEGWYVVIYFKAISQAILEIERFFRITDDIIKFIVVKRED